MTKIEMTGTLYEVGGDDRGSAGRARVLLAPPLLEVSIPVEKDASVVLGCHLYKRVKITIETVDEAEA